MVWHCDITIVFQLHIHIHVHVADTYHCWFTQLRIQSRCSRSLLLCHLLFLWLCYLLLSFYTLPQEMARYVISFIELHVHLCVILFVSIPWWFPDDNLRTNQWFFFLTYHICYVLLHHKRWEFCSSIVRMAPSRKLACQT